MVGWVKDRTFIQETAVYPPCETSSQHWLLFNVMHFVTKYVMNVLILTQILYFS